MRFVSKVFALAVVVLPASAVLAQPKTPPLPSAAPTAGVPSAAPNAAAVPSVSASAPDAAKAAPMASSTSSDAPPKPPTIDVDDPLLAPVPPAPHTISGFKEVLNLLSNESLTLRIAQIDIQRAKGQERVALAAALPSLTANANGSLTPILPEPTFALQPQQRMSGGISVQLTQPFSARSWYAIGTAEKSTEAVKLRAEDARRQAIAAVANAIVSIVTTERLAELNRVALRASLQRLELTKRRRRIGSGTDLDIVRAEQDAATARTGIVTGDENLRKAREALGSLLGKTEAYGVPTTFTLNDIEPALRSACKAAKPDERTDVLAAKVDLDVAKRGVTDVKLAFLPTAQISTSVSLNDSVLETAASPGVPASSRTLETSSWSISGLITIPLWDGGARYGQMKTAEAAVETAKTRVAQATVTATVESTQAQRAITVAEQARQVSEKARDLARETERLAQVAFSSGAGTSLDLVDAGRVLRQAELDLAVKELEVVRAKIAALLALSACDL
ncbi:MAG: TolC family protein [Polyangiaceae bacterium]|nr:TolC family protein [Polyangiaceae bacterium]